MDPKIQNCGKFILGVAMCFAVAGLSVLIESLVPGDLLGASIIALFMGTIINSFFHPDWMKPALKFTSKKVLEIAKRLLLNFENFSMAVLLNFSAQMLY